MGRSLESPGLFHDPPNLERLPVEIRGDPVPRNYAGDHVSYIFKLVRKNGDFVKKSGSRRSVNLLFEHQFACQGPPPENVTNFKPFNLGGYWDSDQPPHHSSDVKSCGESISERVTDA